MSLSHDCVHVKSIMYISAWQRVALPTAGRQLGAVKSEHIVSQNPTNFVNFTPLHVWWLITCIITACLLRSHLNSAEHFSNDIALSDIIFSTF